MDTEIIIALISSAGGIIVGCISIYINKSVVSYRLGKVEEAVKENSNCKERVAAIERDTKTAFNRLDRVENDVEKLEDRLNR